MRGCGGFASCLSSVADLCGPLPPGKLRVSCSWAVCDVSCVLASLNFFIWRFSWAVGAFGLVLCLFLGVRPSAAARRFRRPLSLACLGSPESSFRTPRRAPSSTRGEKGGGPQSGQGQRAWAWGRGRGAGARWRGRRGGRPKAKARTSLPGRSADKRPWRSGRGGCSSFSFFFDKNLVMKRCGRVLDAHRILPNN